MNYFLGHIYPGYKIGNATKISKSYDNSKIGSDRPLSVFLCHMIDVEQARTIVGSLADVPDKVFASKLSKISSIFDFEIYYKGRMHDKNGKEIDLMLLALPTTSADIVRAAKKSDPTPFLSEGHLKFIDTVQAGVDFSKELGATTVGLGGFNSIMTNNGQFLDSHDMNLTTGNAYTTATTIEAALKAHSDQKAGEENEMNVVCIGAAGNIVSTCASLIADHCKQLTLIHHSDIEKSPKLINAVTTILKEIAASEATSELIINLQPLLRKKMPQTKEELLELLSDDLVKKHFTVSHDIADTICGDIIICGTSSVKPIIFSEHLKKDAVIVDLSIPPNIDPKIVAQRQDVKYIVGGIAAFPVYNGKKGTVDSEINQLEEGSAYACISETIMLSMSDTRNVHNIGPISKSLVQMVTDLAKQTGFKLGRNKTK